MQFMMIIYSDDTLWLEDVTDWSAAALETRFRDLVAESDERQVVFSDVVAVASRDRAQTLLEHIHAQQDAYIRRQLERQYMR